MLAKGYTVKYVCTKCGDINTYDQYGIESDMMTALKRIVDPPFCYKCKITDRMDVLHVISELVEDEKKYNVAWRCDKCCARWSTNEQVGTKQRFSDIGMSQDKKPSCIRLACKSEPKDIRLTSVSL
jgi:hypothetical protein